MQNKTFRVTFFVAVFLIQTYVPWKFLCNYLVAILKEKNVCISLRRCGLELAYAQFCSTIVGRNKIYNI